MGPPSVATTRFSQRLVSVEKNAALSPIEGLLLANRAAFVGAVVGAFLPLGRKLKVVHWSGIGLGWLFVWSRGGGGVCGHGRVGVWGSKFPRFQQIF
jgi:hypothetical protein